MNQEEAKYYHDLSVDMLTKRMLNDYGQELKLNKATGPEGFAEGWIKRCIDGIAFSDEIVAKFMQQLYSIGKKKKKRTNKKKN
jgi:hypothetical protein